MKKVNFFIIGSPKTGTSAINLFLSKHPEIFMSRPKDTRYFCKDFHKSSDKLYGLKKYFPIRNLEQFNNCFSESKNESNFGETSTMYFHSKEAPKLIYKYNSNSKIILIIREPLSHLESLHGLLINHKLETELDFNKALEKAKHLKLDNYPRRSSHPYLLFYFPVAEMYDAINSYYTIFGQNNVKIVLFEDLKKNNKKVYLEILEFLQIKEPKELPNFIEYNSRHKVRFVFIRNFFNSNVWKFIWYVPSKILPVKFKSFLQESYFKLNRAPLEKTKITSKTKKMVFDYYKEDIEKTSDLINIDLKKVWYNK